jgi:protocatechuate 3,4-dioxygenase beta subunit
MRRAEAYADDSASAGSVTRLHVTAVRLGGLADDGEPETGAGHPARARGPVEAVEDVWKVLVGQAGAVIADGDRPIGERYLHHSAGRAPLAGVVEQVRDRAADSLRLAVALATASTVLGMSEPTQNGDTRISRRVSLVKLGGFVAAAAGAAGWKVASSENASADSSTGAGVTSGAVACVLAPEMTEGPYYIPGERVRSDITEGKAGAPLTLRLTIVDASTCKPVPRAVVDIWHADAGGLYSGEAMLQTEGQTFLRGIQRTNARGVATFETIYPGWYTGRAVHIHVKVHLGGNVVHTGQLFFPEALTQAVYKKAPYNRRPGPDVPNAADAIYRNGGSKSTLSVRRSAAGYAGAIAMGVHRA